MEISIKIDSTRLTFDDLLALEDAQDGKRPFHALGQVIAKFIIDEKGEYLGLDNAMGALRSLTLDQINEVAGKFSEAVQESQKSAVPPAKGGS